MARQPINPGTGSYNHTTDPNQDYDDNHVVKIGSQNAGNGDPLRTAMKKINEAFDKVDSNFIELYAATGGLDLEAVPTSVIPELDDTYSLGSPTKRWKDVFVTEGSIYIGDVKLSNNNGTLVINRVTNGGLMTEQIVEGGTDSVQVDLTGLATEDYVDQAVGAITVPVDVSDLTDTQGLLGQGGSGGLPTITVPAVAPTTYKGLQVSYGVIHSNSNSDELNVNKIVIHKPAFTTVTIDSQGGERDDFRVSRLADSDVIAMFVVYGDVNGPKSLSTLQAFAEAAIDNVILDGGVEGEFNTVDEMKAAFATNYATLASAADGLVANFQFFEFNTSFSVSANLSGQGTGSGFNVNSLSYNLETDTISVSGWSNGSGYTVNDVIVIPGTSISYEGTPLVSPDNDVTITITGVNLSGFITTFTVSGTLPRPEPQWPENNIPDGGADQYDSGNYINTNFATEISYNSGNTVTDGTAAFGAGSVYSFAYQESIFALFVSGNSASFVSTSGNSGADGNSTTEAGSLFDPGSPEQTFTNAVSHINLVGDIWAGPLVTFAKTDYGDEVDEISEGLHITRGNQGWLYNPLEDEGHDDNTPTNSLWNNDGWDDFSNVESREYKTLESIWGGNFRNIPGAKMIMLDETTGKYWAIEFLSWTDGQNGGGFSYTRRELNLAGLEEGIRFPDGTRLTSAAGIGRVKSRASRDRRIEEVVGNNTVSVTERVTQTPVSVTINQTRTDYYVYIDWDQALYDLSQGDTNFGLEFSLDNTTWYAAEVVGSSFEQWLQIYIVGDIQLSVTQGDTAFYRVSTGGDPVVWWDKRDLPGGSSNFRGAVIDYHAYSGEATWIGTIHIVDDDGEEHITHTEVSSGSSDSENDDLWLVPTEGRISYRRIDGEAKTLKVHWTAKVFYGSELYD